MRAASAHAEERRAAYARVPLLMLVCHARSAERDMR